MKVKRLNKGVLLALVFLVGIMLLVGVACEPYVPPIEIENRTDMTLSIYVQEHERGKLEPNESIEIEDLPGTLSQVLIEAKDIKGEVIFSKDIGMTELYEADWKVVIPPQSTNR